VISGFHCEVDEICAFLGHYAACSVDSLTTFRDNLSAYTGIWWGKLREIAYLEDPAVDGRVILRWIFRKWYVGVWTGSSWLRTDRLSRNVVKESPLYAA